MPKRLVDVRDGFALFDLVSYGRGVAGTWISKRTTGHSYKAKALARICSTTGTSILKRINGNPNLRRRAAGRRRSWFINSCSRCHPERPLKVSSRPCGTSRARSSH